MKRNTYLQKSWIWWTTLAIELGLLLLLTGLGTTGSSPALAQEIDMQASITNKELVRNGGFNHDKTAWYLSGIRKFQKNNNPKIKAG